MDWNSFFSTMSQSAAGLIAIITAFVISKLLGENEKQEKLEGEVDELIIEYNDAIQRISVRKFEWYDKINIEYSKDLEKAIERGEFENLSDEKKLERLFQIEPRLFRTENCIIELNNLIRQIFPNQGFGKNFRIVIAPNGLWNNISNEREMINQVKIDSITLINKFKKVKSDIISAKKNLTPFRTTIYILCLGFFLTVIYPLHFMPMALNEVPKLGFSFNSIFELLFSLKGGFLLILSFVVIIIFGYFVLVLKRTYHRYKQLENNLQERYFNIGDYSRYFDHNS